MFNEVESAWQGSKGVMAISPRSTAINPEFGVANHDLILNARDSPGLRPTGLGHDPRGTRNTPVTVLETCPPALISDCLR